MMLPVSVPLFLFLFLFVFVLVWCSSLLPSPSPVGFLLWYLSLIVLDNIINDMIDSPTNTIRSGHDDDDEARRDRVEGLGRANN